MHLRDVILTTVVYVDLKHLDKQQLVETMLAVVNEAKQKQLGIYQLLLMFEYVQRFDLQLRVEQSMFLQLLLALEQFGLLVLGVVVGGGGCVDMQLEKVDIVGINWIVVPLVFGFCKI